MLKLSTLKAVSDVVTGKSPSLKIRRSSRWPKVRLEHLQRFPTCAVCGGSKKLEVHHIEMFHVKPELELEPSNLITLCEDTKRGVTCHLLFGHLGNYKTVNPEVKADCETWKEKFERAKNAK